MRIANVMLGKGLGGIEQSFVDYTAALGSAGHEVAVVTHPEAAINGRVSRHSASHLTLENRGPWDRSAPERLGAILRTLRADLVLAHGGRAIQFARRAAAGAMPVVAVAHNYQFKHVAGTDAVLAITRHMQEALAESGVIEPSRIHVMPNMIEMRGGFIRPVWRSPPRIGTLGRFVEKKGFATLLDAFALMAGRGHAFCGIIAGEGEQGRALQRQAERLGLTDRVEFPGWVADAAAFLKSIDLFCLPSHHEPFGIVLLEAMAAKLPIVTTDAEGPREIVTAESDAIMVPRGDPVALADALGRLLVDQDGARNLASNAFYSVRTRFSREKIAESLSETLLGIAARWQDERPIPA